jgi:hypothetical protein
MYQRYLKTPVNGYLERLAVKYGKRPPDYLRVLRDYGAKTKREFEELT